MVYLFYGTQKFTIKNRVSKIVKESLGNVDDMNYVRMDLDEVSLFDVVDEANFLPLGYDRKAILATNAIFFKKEDKKLKEDSAYINLIEYLTNPNPDVDLIFTYYEDEIDKDSKALTLIRTSGKVTSSPTPKDVDWKLFVTQYFTQQLKIPIDKDASLEIAERTKYDMELFLNNANKLSLYTNHVTYDDVCLMVAKPLEDSVFAIMNALLSNKNGRALAVYRDLRTKGDETVSMLYALASSFRMLNQVSYLANKGYSVLDIATKLKINEYRAKAVYRQIYSISSNAIARALEQLHILDYQIKSGLVDHTFMFEMFLVNFSTR